MVVGDVGDFRDEYVAASLKREVERHLRGRARVHFRDEYVAASLKQALAANSDTGLNHFRDEYVAASLKLSIDDGAGGEGAGFPRRIRRGLIEACRPRAPPSASSNFRDEYVAASLKHFVLCCCSRPQVHFRDEYVAASLKPETAK